MEVEAVLYFIFSRYLFILPPFIEEEKISYIKRIHVTSFVTKVRKARKLAITRYWIRHRFVWNQFRDITSQGETFSC